MDGLVRIEAGGGLGVATLAAPPVNALARALRAALLDALGRLAADGGVRAVVLAAEGPAFSAGLDVREVGRPDDGPTLAALCDAVERCPKPVLALVGGTALGAGAELALAARWRLGTPAARMGFPDLALGLVPGGGGTQRLPRLVGIEPALGLLQDGRPLGAEGLRRLGLLDGVVAGDPLAGARAFLDALPAGGPGRSDRPGRLGDPRHGLRALARARRALPPGAEAERDLVDCVEAALLLPPAQGRAFEAERHALSLARPQARALRHAFLAERRASATLLRRARDGGREVTPAGEAVVERLGRAMGRAAGALVRGGTPRDLVDRALVDWGMPLGPFGGTGGGAGASGAALVRRINAAVAAEGARLVAEGVATALDVDALAVAALGVPRASGGPLALAEAGGLAALCRDMGAWAAEDPVWAVPPLLAEWAQEGAPRPAAA